MSNKNSNPPSQLRVIARYFNRDVDPRHLPSLFFLEEKREGGELQWKGIEWFDPGRDKRAKLAQEERSPGSFPLLRKEGRGHFRWERVGGRGRVREEEERKSLSTPSLLVNWIKRSEMSDRPPLGVERGRGGILAGELKWAFNQCPFLNTSHEINDRKWRPDKKIAYPTSPENCLDFPPFKRKFSTLSLLFLDS